MEDLNADLALGRDAYARAAWPAAYEALARADGAAPLAAPDLELLARAAYMLGRDDDYVAALERAHDAQLAAEDPLAAVRCAFWIGHNRAFRGELGPAAGWFARARRLLDEPARGDCCERGWVLVGDMLECLFAGDRAAALVIAEEIAAIGERFDDADLAALGVMEHGRMLVFAGRRSEGLRLIDETMLTVTTGRLSPVVAGIVYCNTIAFCGTVYELRRARDWTAALSRWCERQPGMVAHNGPCLVHRAEIMTLGGAWQDALDELRRIGERYTQGALNRRSLGEAAYRQGEVHRLRGEGAAAEDAYRTASRRGREPQPGLALLRLVQGKGDAAQAAIRRAVAETAPLPRAALLPAYVRIMVAGDELDAARAASVELDEIAQANGGEALAAIATQARGEVALAGGDAAAALVELRAAWQAWRELDAPYLAAGARALVGRACRALGDEDAAGLELEAARDVFAELRAAPDLREVETLLRRAGRDGADTAGLTARELEVLRLVASGAGNREIGAALVISEHTVARHVQNIFAKLGVSSRTAASAYAFEHGLA